MPMAGLLEREKGERTEDEKRGDEGRVARENVNWGDLLRN